MREPGNDLAQIAHHLAAVAHAQREHVAAAEEGLELVARARVEQDGLGPALARAEHVAVGEAAAGGDALEVCERHASGDDVAHVHVDRVEAGAIERRRHFDLAVDALLAQDGDPAASRPWRCKARRRRRPDRRSALRAGPDRPHRGCARIPRARTRDGRAAPACARWSRTRRAAGRCASASNTGAAPRTRRMSSLSFGLPMACACSSPACRRASTASRSCARTCSTAPSSSVNSAASTRSCLPPTQIASRSSVTPQCAAKAISHSVANRPPSERS